MWEALEKKAEFLHNALNQKSGGATSETQPIKQSEPEMSVEDLIAAGVTCCELQRPDPATRKAPCKHWIKDYQTDGFVNTLTGETIEL